MGCTSLVFLCSLQKCFMPSHFSTFLKWRCCVTPMPPSIPCAKLGMATTSFSGSKNIVQSLWWITTVTWQYLVDPHRPPLPTSAQHKDTPWTPSTGVIWKICSFFCLAPINLSFFLEQTTRFFSRACLSFMFHLLTYNTFPTTCVFGPGHDVLSIP